MHGWHAWVGNYPEWSSSRLPFCRWWRWRSAPWLARRRAAGATRSDAWRTSLVDLGIVYGTVPFIWMTMLPGSGAGVVPGRVSLVPLRDLATMPTSQVVGNLLIFAAVGFLAPLRFPALASVGRILALAAAGSILIETAQYVLRLDRVSSVDDVLLNAAGAGLAALRVVVHGGRLAGQRRPRPARPALVLEQVRPAYALGSSRSCATGAMPRHRRCP